VLTWAWGYDGFVVIRLLWRDGRVVVDEGVGLGEYDMANALCTLGWVWGKVNF
jgi:hypothetical protein